MNFSNEYTFSKINDNERQNYANYKFCIAPSSYTLQDTRSVKDFKIHLLGGYPKNKVNSLLEKSLTESNIEKGCYCAFQLLASGQSNQLWDKLSGYLFKNINIGNPSLPFWLANKYQLWQKMVAFKEFSKDGILMMRNIQQFRNIIAEMVIMSCQSRKRKLDTLKFKIKDSDFIIANFHQRCKSRGNMLIGGLCGNNDPIEVKTAANEFCYHLLNKNIQECLYWLNWILYWEKINMKKYKSFTVQARQIEGIPSQHQRDVIWLLWSIFHQVRSRLLDNNNNLGLSSSKKTQKLEKQLDALWDMYYKNWKPGTKTKRLPLLIWSIHYLVYPLDWSIPVIENINTYVKAVSNVNLMFAKMKKQCVINKYENNELLPQASLLDNLPPTKSNNHLFHNTGQLQSTNPYQHLGDIGSSSGLNVIIEHNDNPFYNSTHMANNNNSINNEINNYNTNASRISNSKIKTKQKYKNKKSQSQELTESMEKMNIMSSLDKYLQ